MALRIAINGFGRIGRIVLRRAMTKFRNEFEFVGINDLTDAATLAHLLKYDTVHGRFPLEVNYDENNLIIDGMKVPISAERQLENLPWKNVDVTLESTGVFRSREQLEKHLAYAKKVILSAPAKGELDGTIVLGVNDSILNNSMNIVSNASCTTNCLAPMVRVLNENFGVEKGFMVTIHAYTNDQRILDMPHSDLRRARSAAANAIPTSTGAAKAVGLVIPEIKGKLTGYAVRVPVPDGSMTDLSVILKKETTKSELNAAMKAAADTYLKGILEYTSDQIVSSDIVGNDHSCIFDSDLTDVNGNFAKIVGWYDNEFGYSCRTVDLMRKFSNFL